jgi:D-serine deaminase-like pyridoxal phosphate-dependent protein
MGYEGHTVFIKSYKEREGKVKQALNLLVATRELLEERRLECRVVSAGGTGTYDITGSFPGVTEVQAGSYVMMDTNYNGVEGIGGEFRQALSLLTSVISRPTDDRAILDAGMKAISVDMGIPEIAYPGSGKVGRISEEHIALVELEGIAKKELEVGGKIEIIPSHACTTINLHNYFYGIRDGIVELIWSIKARGKFE